MRPTIRQLEYVVALAESLNFRRAAETCHATQPALSAQLRQLETAIGSTLFERDRRRVLLTPAGEAFLPHARAVLAAADDAVAAVQTLRDPLAGELRLGVIPTVAPYVLPRALPRVRKRFPELRLLLVEERTSELVRRLQEGRLDAALLALEADLGEVEQRVLFADPFLLAVPKGHALAERKRLKESDLNNEEVMLLEDGHCLRYQAMEVCRRAKNVEEGDFRASSLGTLVQMVAGGLGVTLVPAVASTIETRGTREIVLLPFSRPGPSRTIGLIWRPGTPRAKGLQQLADVLAENPPEGVVPPAKPKVAG